MIKFPRLKTFLTVFPLSATTWGVRGGTDEIWRIRLTDERAVRAFGALLPFLNGQTTTDDILTAVEQAGQYRPAAAAVLRQLEISSLLEEADTSGLSEQDLQRFDSQLRFFSRFTQQGGALLQARLRDSRVALLGDDQLAESLYASLARSGFGDVTILARRPDEARHWHERTAAPHPQTRVLDLQPDEIWPADLPEPQLLFVCQGTHDARLLEAVDALSKRRHLPWLLVRTLDLQEGWVGPLFVPGETASYRSLDARLRANMTGYAEFQAFDAHVRAMEAEQLPVVGGLAATFDLLASIAVIEAIKFITEMKVPELLGRFLTINLWSWETELHDVLRLPSLDRVEQTRPSVFPWRVTGHEQDAAPSGRA